jgi:hypothetical protein
MYSGDTKLRSPSIAWDTVEAAWGTTWEKVGKPYLIHPTAVYDGITVEICEHWMAASPVVDDEISGIAKKTNGIYLFMPHMLVWCHPDI